MLRGRGAHGGEKNWVPGLATEESLVPVTLMEGEEAMTTDCVATRTCAAGVGTPVTITLSITDRGVACTDPEKRYCCKRYGANQSSGRAE